MLIFFGKLEVEVIDLEPSINLFFYITKSRLDN